MSVNTNFDYKHKSLYNDLCAPASTLAVGLNSWVVVQPETADSVIVASSKAALKVIVFLPCFLQVLDNVDIDNS